MKSYDQGSLLDDTQKLYTDGQETFLDTRRTISKSYSHQDVNSLCETMNEIAEN